jgi:hypothetical protein
MTGATLSFKILCVPVRPRSQVALGKAGLGADPPGQLQMALSAALEIAAIKGSWSLPRIFARVCTGGAASCLQGARYGS